MKASYKKYVLDFYNPSGTSRGVLTKKETWIVRIADGEKFGLGECGLLRGLSIDDVPEFEDKLRWACEHVDNGFDELAKELTDFPSILFGMETALRSFASEDPYRIFDTSFSEGTSGIPINGLVWMGGAEFMQRQIEEKIALGFNCIKLKIGAIDFEQECQILRSIRAKYSPSEIELRVDANGAFSSTDALDRLIQLSGFEIHSIEQPISVNQHDTMAVLAGTSPIPIALDEELIGVNTASGKRRLLEDIRPQYIILKPSLVGGFKSCDEWIEIAASLNIGWWITSALESNIGLNAIAQYAASKGTTAHQGLGTGALFSNNFDSPLKVRIGHLWYDHTAAWDVSALGF